MENKKPIIIAVIVLLILTTSWLLAGKFQDLKTSKNANAPASSGTQEALNEAKEKLSPITPIATDIFPITGTVEGVDNNFLTLATEARGLSMDVTSDYSVFLLDGENEVVTELDKLKTGTKVKVRHKGTTTSEDKKFNPTDANQGVVTAIDDISMTLQMESGERIVDITAKPNIYMMDGETSVAKTAADIQVGSVVAVAIDDSAGRAVAIVIRIDKL